MAACPGSASTLWTSAAAHALFGLNIDDPDISFYTCMKELFDNAVDACSGSGRIESGEIHLRVPHIDCPRVILSATAWGRGTLARC